MHYAFENIDCVNPCFSCHRLMVLVLLFLFLFCSCLEILFPQERGIQLHGNVEVDEETRFSAVVRRVDDSGYGDCEDTLLDSCNDETFQCISSSSMGQSFTGKSVGEVVDAVEVSSRSSYVVCIRSVRFIQSCINYSFVVWEHYPFESVYYQFQFYVCA